MTFAQKPTPPIIVGTKKLTDMHRNVPIPDNRPSAATSKALPLSAPVRDLADLLAQIAADQYTAQKSTAAPKQKRNNHD